MKTKRPVPLLIKYYTNKPLFSTPEYVEEIFSYLESRGEKEEIVFSKKGDEGEERSKYNLPVTYNEDTGVGVINLYGHSTYKPTGWEAMSGGYSYRGLASDVESLIEKGASTIVYNIDSYGGEAHGMIDTSKKLREITRDKGVKTVAFVDGAACSAGYGIASSADEIIATPDSHVGSIGVVVRLSNKQAKDQAPHTTYVYAGDNKVAYDKEGEFTPEFIREVEDTVETLYRGFTHLVANNRGINVDQVVGTQATVYLPEKAKDVGLVDKIMSAYDFQEYLADIADNSWDTEGESRKILAENNNKEKEMLEELKASLEEAVTYNETLEEQVADLQAKLQEDKESKAALASDLDKLRAEVEALTKENLELKASARKEKLASVVGEAKSQEMLEAMATLDDEAFEVVLQGLGKSVEATRESGMFQTVGSSVTQEIDAPEANAEEEVDPTTKALINILGE